MIDLILVMIVYEKIFNIQIFIQNFIQFYIDKGFNFFMVKLSILLKVNDILKLQELKFHYKYENNFLPYYLQNVLFEPNIQS